MTAYAGAIDNRSNHSASYIRHLSRASDTRLPDASAYNPAGTAFMNSGWHIELDNQTLAKYNQNSTSTFSFTSDVLSPFLPTGFVVLKRDDWAGFASFTLLGGGGNLHYDRGSATVLPIVSSLATANPATAPDLQLSSLQWGATLGGAYAFHPKVSASFAARWVISAVQIRGEARGEELIDHEETAQIPTFMLGLHAKPFTGFDLSLRYEHIAKLEWQVQKSDLHLTRAMNPVAAAGYERLLRGTLRAEGEVFKHDLPGVLAIGAGYTLNPFIRVDISQTVYLQTMADWEGDQDDIDNGYEPAIGIEISPKPGLLSLSAGAMLSLSGADSDTYFIENPALDGYTLSGGGRWQVSSRWALDAGVAYSKATDDVANHASLGPIDLKKNVWVYGLSVGLHLP